MLSKEAFVAGITIIKKAFIGWQFDLNDNVQVNLWYSAFQNLTDKQFNELVYEYLSNNKQPPMCIKSLTDIYVERSVKMAKIPPEKALNTVREIVSECGGWDYDGREEIYMKLASYPMPLRETVHEFEGTLRTMAANDSYTAERFRKAYEEKLMKSVANEVNKYLGLSVPDNSKLLGNGFLPSET